MTTGSIEMTETAASRAAVVHGHIEPGQIADFLSQAYTEVLHVLEDQHSSPHGPPFARFHETATGFDIEAGFPTTVTVVPTGRVTSVEIPGGPTVAALHQGAFETLGETYEALDDWLVGHGYERTDDAWETYLDEPGVPEPRTLVRSPCSRP